ncbi:MAG: endopeptidase La [Chloroflexi bacterium]|nr:endopeptidase La [Chloroflexota bacterium]
MGKEDQHDPVEEQEQEDQTPENQVPEQDEEQQTPDVTANEGQSGAIEIRSKQADDDEDTPEIPEELPVLPLRGLVVYPETAVPLLVGQPRSIRLVDDVVAGNRLVALVASHDPDNEEPGPDEIYRIGTAAAVHRLFRAPDGTIRLLVQGLARIAIEDYTATQPYLKARVRRIPEIVEDNIEVQALMRNITDQFRRLSELVPSIPAELIATALSIEHPLQLVYTVATYMRMDLEDSQNLIEMDSTTEKLRRVMALLGKELEVLELGRKIQEDAQSEIDKVQREYYLREQLKAIKRELGEEDEQQVEVEEFRRHINEAGMPEEAEREARRELDRLSKLPTAAAEYGVIRTYLDWLTSLPWNVSTEDNLDIPHARRVLDEDHYDLEDIKERILEYLAVRKLRRERSEEAGEQSEGESDPTDYIRREREGVILCFVGPPGVGKTSLGASIARATGRKFIRMSLGGLRDEAEIRGHRRTYIGAMPGRIIQAIRRAGTNNPVIMLDEIDKLGRDFRGDPASALLEVLDPEQNSQFRDHYLDVPFDLSQVMFITTANMLEPIPGPLRDRMEILQLSGYTDNEKVRIAQEYLVPRQIRENGLRPEEISFSDDAIRTIIRDYTREAGVRNLEREIGAVCRKIVTRIAEGTIESAHIEADDVREFLGKPKYYGLAEIAERTDIPGVATGLAWTPVGGDVMFVEAARMPGQKGFIVTGQLGDVMQESARAALSYVRSHAQDLGIDEKWFDQNDVHLHVPAGAVPKDGPSAGITMATALASLLTGRPVKSNLAMTGEITLRGQVLPIGGVKEKVLAAHRVGLDTVILPRRNEKDLDDIPEEIREKMNFILVDRVDQVLEAALGEPVLSPDGASTEEAGEPVLETVQSQEAADGQSADS